MEIMSTISAVNSSPKPTAQDDLIIPISQRKTMITLLPDDCRWPIGDPQVAGFHFCGKRKQDGHPYCEFHVRRASTPGRARVMTYRPRDAA
jgi:GcrA cell cycle regulator